MEILLVDDNPDFLTPLKEELYKRGYVVYTAGDGVEATNILSATPVDAIISDIKMPRVDGIKLHQWVRSLKRYATTTFVFISGYQDEYTNTLDLNAERDFFLDKTMTLEEILRFIDRLVFGKFADAWM
jgi:DNA-binding response OmpR family regulator